MARTGSFLFNQMAISKLRKSYPSGVLVIDFSLYADALPQDGPEFHEAPCLGAEEGLVMIWQRVGGSLWYIASHEIGHCLWLRHWENAGNEVGTPPRSRSERSQLHDELPGRPRRPAEGPAPGAPAHGGLRPAFLRQVQSEIERVGCAEQPAGGFDLKPSPRTRGEREQSRN